MKVPGRLGKELARVSEALEGETTAAPDHFFRMLYFSASTITTLGIGDIQPVSTLARVLVTVEAVLGLIFVGLFLNALAGRYRGRGVG